MTNISLEFLPAKWQQRPTGIDMEQNYVTVTLCIRIRKPSIFRHDDMNTMCPCPAGELAYVFHALLSVLCAVGELQSTHFIDNDLVFVKVSIIDIYVSFLLF